MENLLGPKATEHAKEALSLPEEIDFICTILSNTVQYDPSQDGEREEYGMIECELPSGVYFVRMESAENQEHGIVNFESINTTE